MESFLCKIGNGNSAYILHVSVNLEIPGKITIFQSSQLELQSMSSSQTHLQPPLIVPTLVFSFHQIVEMQHKKMTLYWL